MPIAPSGAERAARPKSASLTLRVAADHCLLLHENATDDGRMSTMSVAEFMVAGPLREQWRQITSCDEYGQSNSAYGTVTAIRPRELYEQALAWHAAQPAGRRRALRERLIGPFAQMGLNERIHASITNAGVL